VLGNLLVAARQAGLGAEAAETRARALLDRLGLTTHASRYPSQLSGGQQQRVAIAQQLLCSEHLLLMDEPFSGLDCVALREVCALLTEVANLDSLNTIVVATHDVAAALAVADTIWLLGRDRGPDGPRPGARIQATYDLLARGIAWSGGDVWDRPECAALHREIVARFREL
jgi:polar amino acid transport system ATP-binding protein/sulfate transport system ATP-binding protein